MGAAPIPPGMVTATDVSMLLHLVFAGFWTGGVLFVATGIIPIGGRDGVGPAALAAITTRLTTVSRVSAVIMLVTGGHIAAERYTAESLTGTTAGHAVLAMVVLWLALAALVEIGASRVNDETGTQAFYAAGVVAVLLLLDAGLLLTGI